MAFMFKAITPQLANIDQIREKMMNALRHQGVVIRKDFESTTETWKHKVTFAASGPHMTRAGGIGIDVGPISGDTDERGKNYLQIWNWLNAGTGSRHAVMSQDWASKTSPGRIRSGAGQGKMVKVSMAINQPPIEPRDWSNLIWQKNEPLFAAAVMEAVRQGLAQWTRESNASGR